MKFSSDTHLYHTSITDTNVFSTPLVILFAVVCSRIAVLEVGG